MASASDSDCDHSDAAASNRTSSRQRTNSSASTSATTAPATGTATATSPPVKTTRRKRLNQESEATYASHIASLQDSGDRYLPSGWIAASLPSKRRSNGVFRRPDEEPPIPDYRWNGKFGVWIPSVRILHETSLMARLTTKNKVPSLSRSRPFNKWTATEDTQNPSTVAVGTTTGTTGTVTEKIVDREKRKKPKTDSVEEIPVARVARMNRNRSASQTTDSKTDSVVERPVESLAGATRKRSTSQTDSVREVTAEPRARAKRKRSVSRTENGDEKPPPRPNRKLKKKPITLPVNSDRDPPDDESSVDDEAESNQSILHIAPKRYKKKKPTYHGEHLDENEFHPNSIWEEPYSDDLTLYERHRTARPIPKGTILFHMDAIRPEIRCAICLDILQNTRIVRECLHRFCESCIEQALTFQNVEAVGGRRKECPICRIYIPSRRSLAPDTHMDTLISRLLDNLIWAEDNDPAIYLRSPQKSSQMLTLQQRPRDTMNDGNNVNDEVVIENDDKRKDKDKENDLRSSSQGTSREDRAILNVSVPPTPPNDSIPQLIKIVLVQQPDPNTQTKYFDDLLQPYLTLASDAPGSVLKTFICQKHGFVTPSSNVDNATTQYLHDNETNSINPSLILLWTMYRLEPYLISANDTLQYVMQNRTDTFQGRYMPIYYRCIYQGK